MEDVASAERIYRLYLECLHVMNFAVFEPIHAVRAVGESEKAFKGLSELLERGT